MTQPLPVMDPKKTLTVTRTDNDNVIEIHGTKVNKVMLLMAVADVVWPGWFLDEKGKDCYLREYADNITDNTPSPFGVNGFWDEAKEQAIAVMNAKGIAVHDVYQQVK